MVTLEPDGEVIRKDEGLIHRGKRKPKRKRGIRAKNRGWEARGGGEPPGKRKKKKKRGTK